MKAIQINVEKNKEIILDIGSYLKKNKIKYTMAYPMISPIPYDWNMMVEYAKDTKAILSFKKYLDKNKVVYEVQEHSSLLHI